MGDETAAYYDRGLFFRLCPRIWLFHLHSMVKIQPFSPVFPLAGSTAKAFYRLALFKFTVDKEKYAPLTAGGRSASEL